jgi:hypothetical protein
VRFAPAHPAREPLLQARYFTIRRWLLLLLLGLVFSFALHAHCLALVALPNAAFQ